MPNLHEMIEEQGRTDVEDIKEVPPIPPGSYLCQIVGNYENIISGRKQTPGVQFTLRLVSADNDVDTGQLQEYLSATGQKLHDITIRHTIWDSPYAMQTLTHFLKDTLGIGGPLKEALSRVPGQQLTATISHRPLTGDDGSVRLMAQVASTARAL